ncbi:hypothetical protein PRIPAC_74132 [Pristionchus pacificus]|uniref:Peptidase n=1 Tax=Pristionchus pacificus TaxID=54126 RepID=A0A2A6CEY5_PRIPA|nr:hypothetical protein PRIPAC_74132 [Pristionchus pacificus]|eukprot:PDM76647.1 Peptidase [Pristionchus pacificus]
MSEPNFDAIFSAIETKKPHLISLLAEAVAIPSVSAEPERRPDIVRMVEWVKKHLEQLGATCELAQPGDQQLSAGSTIPLPPILLGKLGCDPKKKTLLVYAHLDVQPASREDGWHTEPFTLTEKDGKLFGRGSTDDKFCLEGMEESGSEGLEETLKARKDSFLSDVSFTCISDNYWLGTTKPCLTYGLRGICYFTVEVAGPTQDLHSGIYGGTLYEPMSDLVWVLSQLLSKDGQIMIPGLADHVAPLTETEREMYAKMDFDHDEYAKHINTTKLLKATKEETLMARMRYPSLSVHGIEGAFHGAGAKTVIPCKVTGKFSIRLVPDMKPKVIDELVVKHLNELWAQRGSPNRFNPISDPVLITASTTPTCFSAKHLKIQLFGATAFHSGPAWLADPHGPNFQAGARAIKRVYGVEPDYTREGGSIPVTLTFQELTGAPVMLLPIGANDDMAHSQNEKINVTNLVKGTKTLAAYILELAKA